MTKVKQKTKKQYMSKTLHFKQHLCPQNLHFKQDKSYRPWHTRVPLAGSTLKTTTFCLLICLMHIPSDF